MSRSIQKTRLVANYNDKSELHFDCEGGFYSWQRPLYDSRGCFIRMVETVIAVANDAEALRLVRKILQEEYNDSMFRGVLKTG